MGSSGLVDLSLNCAWKAGFRESGVQGLNGVSGLKEINRLKSCPLMATTDKMLDWLAVKVLDAEQNHAWKEPNFVFSKDELDEKYKERKYLTKPFEKYMLPNTLTDLSKKQVILFVSNRDKYSQESKIVQKIIGLALSGVKIKIAFVGEFVGVQDPKDFSKYLKIARPELIQNYNNSITEYQKIVDISKYGWNRAIGKTELKRFPHAKRIVVFKSASYQKMVEQVPELFGHTVETKIVESCECKGSWYSEIAGQEIRHFRSGRCEMNRLCTSMPCKNGGYCLPVSENMLKCVCKESFSGEFCENRQLSYNPYKLFLEKSGFYQNSGKRKRRSVRKKRFASCDEAVCENCGVCAASEAYLDVLADKGVDNSMKEIAVTLVWSGHLCDLDMHIVEPMPGGEELWYNQLTSSQTGTLDLDNQAGASEPDVAVENISWLTAPCGAYEIKVRNFAPYRDHVVCNVEIPFQVITQIDGVRTTYDRVTPVPPQWTENGKQEGEFVVLESELVWGPGQDNSCSGRKKREIRTGIKKQQIKPKTHKRQKRATEFSCNCPDQG